MFEHNLDKKILAIESSGEIAQVALSMGNGEIDFLLEEKALSHSETLLPLIINILEKNFLTIKDLDALALDVGPGSFTGLRIGAATAKGLSLPSNTPIITCSALHILAYPYLEIFKDVLVVPAMDARANRAFCYIYFNDSVLQDFSNGAISIEDLCKTLNTYNEKILFLGNAYEKYRDIFKSMIIEGRILTYNMKNPCPDFLLNLQKQFALNDNFFNSVNAISLLSYALDEFSIKSNLKNHNDIRLDYFAKPQAERELLKKQNKDKI